MNDYIFLDKKKDARLILFCRNNISKSARKLVDVNLGILKRGPYKVKKANYPILIKFYLGWLEEGSDNKRTLNIRRV